MILNKFSLYLTIFQRGTNILTKSILFSNFENLTNSRPISVPKNIFILVFLFHIAVAGLSGQHFMNDSIRAEFYLKRANLLYEMSDYDSLSYYYQGALEYYRETGNRSMVIHCLLGMAEYFRIISDNENAALDLTKAEELLEEGMPGYTEMLAGLYYIRGKLLSSQGKFREGLQHVQMAVDIQGPDDWQKNARYLNYIGKIYYWLGDLDSAGIFYQKCFDRISSETDVPVIEKAWYYLNMGLLYRNKGEYDKSLECLRNNIQINIELYGEDFQDLSKSYLNLASYFLETGSHDSARFYLDKAEYLNEKSFSSVNMMPSLYTYRGSLNYLEGNYLEAQHDYYQALQAAIELYSPAHPSLSVYYNNYANSLKAAGDYANALVNYQKSLEFSKKLHYSQVIKSYLYLASTYSIMGQTSKAKSYYNMLISERIRYYGPDHPLLAYDYLSYGDFLMKIGECEAAFNYLNMALGIRKNNLGEKHYLTSDAYRYVGRYYAEANDFNKALENYQKALISVSDQFGSTEFTANPVIKENINLLFFLKILKDKGLALEHLSKDIGQENMHHEYLQASFESYKLAADVIYLMHNEWLTEESRLYLAENERETLLSLLRVSLQLGEQTGEESYIATAFETAENMKYSTLLAILRDQGALETVDVPEGLQNLERQIRMQLAAYKDLVAREHEKAEPDSVRISNWNKKIYELSVQRRGLIRQLGKRYPDFFSIKFHSGILSARNVRNKLDEDEMIIEFVLADTVLITFIIDKDGLSYDRKIIDSLFYRDIKLVYDFVRTDYFNTTSQSISDYFSSASDLYKILLGRHNIPENKRLIIIPDGLLAYLPYEILLTRQVEGNGYDFGNLPYLIRRNPVTYAYSATLTYHTDFRRIRARKGLLAFAPFDPLSTDFTGANVREIPIDRKKLKPLAGSEKEVRSIINIIGGDLRIGREASEFNFKEMASKYRILHLAMHTIIDDYDPLYSKLVFSSNTEGDEDGFLNVFEIYNLNLNASMVVLSACNTGSGIVRHGEGIMSLARAFFYAGIPNVIMTLWTVGDESGGKLMIDFYQDLTKGNTKDLALRNAKISFLHEADPIIRHPYYWSGYIIVGNNDPVFVSRVRKYLLIGVIIILVILGFFYKNRMLKRGKEKKGLQAF